MFAVCIFLLALLFLFSGCVTKEVTDAVSSSLANITIDVSANTTRNIVAMDTRASTKRNFTNLTSEEMLEIYSNTKLNESVLSAKLARKILACGVQGPLVCGANGITYENMCISLNYNSSINYMGTCELNSSKRVIPGTSCNNDYIPVCTANGQTFQNECYAQAFSREIIANVSCSDYIQTGGCVDGDVVCGENNVTYDSKCTALKQKTAIAYEGKCVTTN